MIITFHFTAPSAAGIGGDSLHKKSVIVEYKNETDKAERLHFEKIKFARETGVNLDMITVKEV